MPIRDAIAKLIADEVVRADEAERVATLVMEGAVPSAQLSAFLALLRARGETAEHLAGFVRAMRRHMEPFPLDSGDDGAPLVDTCGVGGDGAGTFNISTTAAFVAAGAGARVAKHGNRAVSSQCGSADVLEALGVNVAATPADAARCLREAGVAFLFAPSYHPAMKHAGPTRRELAMRTIFNLCGPLCNPAGPPHQVVGVSGGLLEIVSGALAKLGATRALVLEGPNGLDELSPAGVAQCVLVELEGGARFDIDPADFGVARCDPADLAGSDAAANAAILEAILDGRDAGPRADATCLNAAAALWVCGLGDSMEDGLAKARASIASGKARAALDAMRRAVPKG